MKNIQMDSEITLLNSGYKISDIVLKYCQLTGQQVVDYFASLKLNVPVSLRIHVIKGLLAERVKITRKERQTLADELNYRLKWFFEFGDTQCVNLLSYYEDSSLDETYLKTFWFELLSYLLERGVSEEHLLDLYSLSAQNNQFIKDVKSFNDAINPIFYDEPNHLDGLSPDKVRPVLFKSSTLVELREIGKKFGVEVPRRLKKVELLESIFDELKSRNAFNQKEADDLSKKSVIMIQRFATDHQIKVSIELKKEEIVEYILEHAHQTKEHYFRPETNAYDFEVDENDDELEIQKEVEQVIESTVDRTFINNEKIQENTTIDKNLIEEKLKLNKVDHDDVSQVETDEQVNPSENDDSVVELSEEESEVKTLDQLIKPAQVFINAGQYQGKPKSFEDDYLDLDGSPELLTEKQRKRKIPAEFRFLFGLIKVILLVVLRVVELVVIVGLIALFIIFVYASVVHFANPEALRPLNDLLNGFDLLGKSILEHISDFYRSFGL